MALKKPVWSEGLFMTQHHLQQQDRYHEELMAERFAAAMPYSWGVASLSLDERALANGQLVVKELNAIFPDGTPVRCAGEDAPPSRQVDAAFAANMKTLPVYAALPRLTDASQNLADDSSAAVARYTRQQLRVRDLNSGGSEQEVAWARANVKLLLGEEPRESYDCVQIADLVRTQSGQVITRDTCVPPVLHIRASAFVMTGMRRIVTAMVSRQRDLAGSRRQRSAAKIDFQASDVAKYWLLNSLNESIPMFSHMADSGLVTPEQAYLELATLIGRLCTFAVDEDPTSIPKFNYLALGDVFEPMFARALSLLDSVIKENYIEIPLNRREDGMYLGKIADPGTLRCEFFLAATGTLPEAEVRDRLPKLSKIASWNQIGPLLNSAVNGARIELEYHPPGALPVKPGVVFFKVQKTPDYWTDIQGTGAIALYHPLPKDALRLSLYAVDPQNL